MLDFTLNVKDLQKARKGQCNFCKLLISLADDSALLSDSTATVVARLQLFWPERVNGVAEPVLHEIGLHPGISGGGGTIMLALIDDSGKLLDCRSATDFAYEPLIRLGLGSRMGGCTAHAKHSCRCKYAI